MVASWFSIIGIRKEVTVFRTDAWATFLVVYTRNEAARVVTSSAETRQIQTLEVKGLMIAVHLG